MHKSTPLGCFFVQKNRLNPIIKNVIFFKYKKILCKRKNNILLSRFCRVCQKKSTFEELRSLLDAKGGCTNGAAMMQRASSVSMISAV